MGALDIRAATTGDLVAILALFAELAEGSQARRPAEHTLGAQVLQQILGTAGRHLLIATMDGALVGTVDMTVVSNLTHHGRPWAVVENVVVAAAFRRQGIGRAMMFRLSEIARAAHCYKMQLTSGSQRLEAHAFYERLGYEPVAQGFKIFFDGTLSPS